MKRILKTIIFFLLIEVGAVFFSEISNSNHQVLQANIPEEEDPPPPPDDPILNSPPQDSVIYLPSGEPVYL